MPEAETMTNRERFLNVMEYRPIDRVPNWEFGPWPQAVDRWEQEGLCRYDLNWDWYQGCDRYQIDAREYLNINFGLMPPFKEELLEQTERYEIRRKPNGVVTKALIEGTSGGVRASMDTYLSFPVTDVQSFREMKKRLVAGLRGRYPAHLHSIMPARWRNREHVLVFGGWFIPGFYWTARQWMGTEGVSLAWYDQPALLHEMMEFLADFTIEVCKPALALTDADYVSIAEDLSMKTGPLLSPRHYKTFIYPHLRRLIDFLKGNGVRYVSVDTDGNPEAVIPLMLEAGVDMLWPLERAANMDPVRLRKKYGRQLRLTGGVDKREVAAGPEAIDRHLAGLAPLIEEGGFIPTIDHSIPPDISLANLEYYLRRKLDLLAGRL